MSTNDNIQSATGFSMPVFLESVRDHKPIPSAHIRHFILNLQSFPEEQISAFLAHAFHQPLSRENTIDLTLAMCDSGAKMDWQGLDKPVVDKHSTGGIGDKVTICLAPLLAALGLAVPTIAGRGLGFSGGTADKLEAISGMTLRLPAQKIQELVRTHGLAFGAQSDDIAPADKKLYALRDVTATVESIPLITASILSKKLSESLGALVMDVKCGSGAFMPTLTQARTLAESIVAVAEGAGTNTRALITNMNQPLGRVAGNWCEVAEAVNILKNDPETLEAAADTVMLTKELAASLLLQTKLATNRDAAFTRIDAELKSGRPFEVFLRVITAQGGDAKPFEKTFSVIPKTRHTVTIRAEANGCIASIHTKSLGLALVLAKAGREKQSDTIDPATSLYHPVKVGARVKHGDVLCELTTNHAEQLQNIQKLLKTAYFVQSQLVSPEPLIQEVLCKKD